MTAQLIAQMVVALGPAALEFVQRLASVWSKDALTAEEVASICSSARKSYEDYIAEARSMLKR